MNEEELGQIFENNFDCYADVDKTKACLPNWYEYKDTMAMTKEKFIEVVTKITSDDNTDNANTEPNINYDGVLATTDDNGWITPTKEELAAQHEDHDPC